MIRSRLMGRGFLAVLRRFSNGQGSSKPLGSVKPTIAALAVVAGATYYVHRRRNQLLTPIVQEASCAAETTKRGDGKFANKTVVITGAAGDIGSTAAIAFAQHGANILVVDLEFATSKLKKLCLELREQGAEQVDWTVCDVTNADQVKEMTRFATQRFGRVDFFFNNAGIQGNLLPTAQLDEKTFKQVMEVNAYGVFLGIKYISQAMIDSGSGGVIINTASVAGLIGAPNMLAYAASKFAVVGMTRSAAKDLAGHNIRVCAIAPGLMEGRMWDTQVAGQARTKLGEGNTTLSEADIKAQERRMIDTVPLKRLGRLSEVASVVVFLCSDDASYMTGVTVPIDGGKLA